MINKLRKYLKNNELKIMIIIAFISVSAGLWDNFKTLWLTSNLINPQNISLIFSIGNLITCIIILFFGVFIKFNTINKFISNILSIKILALIILFIVNQSNLCMFIKILSAIDIIADNMILIALYPLVLLVRKSDKLYSKRKLTEYIAKDIGILIGGVILGKSIANIKIDYNICLLICIILLMLAMFMLRNLKLTAPPSNENKTTKKYINIIIDDIKYIVKTNQYIYYLLYILIGNISYNTALGLKMLFLTQKLNFSADKASIYFLIVGLLADFIGVIALIKFTHKSTKISVLIKFGFRLALYTSVAIIGDYTIMIIAITGSLLVSTMYENKTDAPTINGVETEKQLMFSNYRNVVSIFGKSIGMLFCGQLYNYNIRYTFLVSCIFLFIQIILAFKVDDCNNESKIKFNEVTTLEYKSFTAINVENS